MTLLEKLNLEPDLPVFGNRGNIVEMLGDGMELGRYENLCRFAIHQKLRLTNAEFLAACEEWLKKN